MIAEAAKLFSLDKLGFEGQQVGMGEEQFNKIGPQLVSLSLIDRDKVHISLSMSWNQSP